MLRMVIKMCDFERVPVEESSFYKHMKDNLGQKAADFFTYEEYVPSYEQIAETGSDELKELVFLVTSGVAPGGKS